MSRTPFKRYNAKRMVRRKRTKDLVKLVKQVTMKRMESKSIRMSYIWGPSGPALSDQRACTQALHLSETKAANEQGGTLKID